MTASRAASTPRFRYISWMLLHVVREASTPSMWRTSPKADPSV
jgi:hypothetical protein